MTLFQAFGQFAGQAAAAPATDAGMVLMLPASIANSGGSATLGANGEVSFSGVTNVSLNGCFTSDYTNYVISTQQTGSDSDTLLRLRSSGSDATGSDYTTQSLQANNTSLTASRSTTDKFFVGAIATAQSSMYLAIYGPQLSTTTTVRAVTQSSYLGSLGYDMVGSHSLTTAYDGFTFYATTGTLTGKLQVYGLVS